MPVGGLDGSQARGEPRPQESAGNAGAVSTWWSGDHATGDWGGLRSCLEEQGWSVEAGVIWDTSWPLGGGGRRRTTGRSLWNLDVELDLEQTLGLPHATLFAQGQSQAGRHASDDVGDLQVFSNIDERNFTELYELWYEQRWPATGLRLKVGKLDANSEYAVVDSGGDFLHSSAGFSPSIFALPTYPDPATAVNLAWLPGPGLELKTGVFNADDGGAVSGRRGMTVDFEQRFFIGQARLAWFSGYVTLGAWHQDGDFVRFNGRTERGVEGLYGIVEQCVWQAGPEDSRRLTLFSQAGLSDQSVAEVEQHLSLGAVWTAPWSCRPEDHLGLMLTHAELSDDRASGFVTDETAVELHYRCALRPFLALQPALAFIDDPGGLGDLDDAWVATLRVEVTF